MPLLLVGTLNSQGTVQIKWVLNARETDVLGGFGLHGWEKHLHFK